MAVAAREASATERSRETVGIAPLIKAVET
jgi:hypothetical protein